MSRKQPCLYSLSANTISIVHVTYFLLVICIQCITGKSIFRSILMPFNFYRSKHHYFSKDMIMWFDFAKSHESVNKHSPVDIYLRVWKDSIVELTFRSITSSFKHLQSSIDAQKLYQFNPIAKYIPFILSECEHNIECERFLFCGLSLNSSDKNKNRKKTKLKWDFEDKIQSKLWFDSFWVLQ